LAAGSATPLFDGKERIRQSRRGRLPDQIQDRLGQSAIGGGAAIRRKYKNEAEP
jgi:hypothetical protein